MAPFAPLSARHPQEQDPARAMAGARKGTTTAAEHRQIQPLQVAASCWPWQVVRHTGFVNPSGLTGLCTCVVQGLVWAIAHRYQCWLIAHEQPSVVFPAVAVPLFGVVRVGVSFMSVRRNLKVAAHLLPAWCCTGLACFPAPALWQKEPGGTAGRAIAPTSVQLQLVSLPEPGLGVLVGCVVLAASH